MSAERIVPGSFSGAGIDETGSRQTIIVGSAGVDEAQGSPSGITIGIASETDTALSVSTSGARFTQVAAEAWARPAPTGGCFSQICAEAWVPSAGIGTHAYFTQADVEAWVRTSSPSTARQAFVWVD